VTRINSLTTSWASHRALGLAWHGYWRTDCRTPASWSQRLTPPSHTGQGSPSQLHCGSVFPGPQVLGKPQVSGLLSCGAPGWLTFFPTSSLELIRSSMSARSCLFCLSNSSLASRASSRARDSDRALVSFSLASASARSRSSA
jgi:hypothetical protein